MFLYISIIVLPLMLVLSYVFNRTGLFTKRKEKSFVWKVMHFLGGFFVAMFWSSFFDYSLLVIALTLVVGVLWEFWEYFYGLYKFKKSGTKKYFTKTPDTMGDLILDIAGAAAWALLVLFGIH